MSYIPTPRTSNLRARLQRVLSRRGTREENHRRIQMAMDTLLDFAKTLEQESYLLRKEAETLKEELNSLKAGRGSPR